MPRTPPLALPVLWEVVLDGGVELRAQELAGGRYMEAERVSLREEPALVHTAPKTVRIGT